MQLEFHQLDRRWEHLRVRHSGRQHRLLASLAERGQQTPIVVVEANGQVDRYVVIDGHKRITALQQLGRDKVEAVVWPMNEGEAIVLDRSLRLSEQETALEVGWLLAELEQRFGYSLDELARRFDRSLSWVSRRLALVDALPEAIQQQVREGKIAAQVAMSAGGAHQLGSVPTDSRDLRPVSLRLTESGPTVCRMAKGITGNPATHSRCAGSVFQNATTGRGEGSRRNRHRRVRRPDAPPLSPVRSLA